MKIIQKNVTESRYDVMKKTHSMTMPRSTNNSPSDSHNIVLTRSELNISYLQIFWTFLKLGCIAFGGPAAHLVFFHQTFVQRLHWLNEAEYSQLVALAQILPGPSSSQVGIAIGYVCKSYWGAICAWLGFTLPSVMAMTLLAYVGQAYFSHFNADFFQTIQLIVLAVVIFAFWQMLKSFCSELWQYVLMIASALFLYSSDFRFDQLLVIFIAAGVGILVSKLKPRKKLKPHATALNLVKPALPAYIWLILFVLPFIALYFFQSGTSHPIEYSLLSFYSSASMVFGGGHIILPLLHDDFVLTGLINSEQFDLGYALVQLMPGPLFSFGSYLGSFIPFSSSIWLNSTIATLAIFLPSFFLIFGCLPYWSWLMNQQQIYQAVIGINAAVIGLLLCLIIEMTESSVQDWTEMVFVIAVVALLRTKIPVVLTLILSFISYYLFLSYI